MKKKFTYFIATLMVVISALTLVGCNMGSGFKPNTNYNDDIQVVAPENITNDLFVVEENTTYYTSPGFSLWMEVNGAFLKMDYFYLDGNKRVYDNLYFYKDDYFYIVTDDYKDLYASLSDSADSEYAEEEKEQGYDIQINVKKEGIYKLVFDVDTLKFDMEYKSEIDTPKYYPIKKCQIYSNAAKWVDMSVNPANPDEFVISNFAIGVNETITFQDATHTSIYKITLNESCNEKYGSYAYPSVVLNVGGNYDIYINAKTYEVKLELLNPDTAKYSCVYYDGTDFITLQPYDSAVPYVFRQRIVVDTKNTTSLPKFHTEKYRTYKLTVVDDFNLLSASSKNYYFKQIGTYDVIINLKTFEISVELLPE
ncbi:MAG: hypothetical protein J6B04_06430 [Clostridia bacterium]|nr:hypothetical protein [Clostridia bacterium]